MREFLLSWRSILWSLVAASMTSRSYTPSNECVERADKILAAFDDRFEISSNGVIINKRK